MIEVFYAQFPEPLPENLYADYLYLLPSTLKESNGKYRRWEDRHAHLLGKMLLLSCLKQHGYTHRILEAISYTEFRRPELEEPFDFNISHSGNYAICAVNWAGRIGIDIEEIKSVNLKDFQLAMTDSQWAEIRAHPNPIGCFFDFWTIKESLMKADGRGVHIPLDDIGWQNGLSELDGNTWQLKKLELDTHYATTLACPELPESLTIQPVDFYDPEQLTFLSA